MNQELEFLKNLFSAEAQTINIFSFLLQIVLTTILSLIIGYTYTRFGNALSNRKALSKSFVLIGLTTMLIITIVKSSLALSLGLVGALSIVRFRTAIKEPEELAYFFMVISIGLGIGAGQILVTVIGTISLCLLIFFINRKKTEDILQNLIIRLNHSGGAEVKKVIEILEQHSTQLELRRLDEDEKISEVSFAVSFHNHTALLSAKDDLKKNYPNVSFSFLEIV